jgi:hypothetical protein
MQKGAAAAGSDVLTKTILLFVSGVVVLSALKVRHQLGATGLDDFALEVLHIPIGMDLGLLPAALDLLGHAQNDAVPGLHLVDGDVREVLQLGFVDEGPELDVDAPQPPAVRKLDREVAPTLTRSPPADPVVAAKDAGEVDQPVVPVVASRNGEQLRSLSRDARQRCAVRTEHAVLILRGVGHRVHLVAPMTRIRPR